MAPHQQTLLRHAEPNAFLGAWAQRKNLEAGRGIQVPAAIEDEDQHCFTRWVNILEGCLLLEVCPMTKRQERSMKVSILESLQAADDRAGFTRFFLNLINQRSLRDICTVD